MKKKYDVIIIGAGIGGLVCGCYLVKNGLKVALFEKNDHPGGCCTSFESNGVQFDSAAHSLGGLSLNGPLGKMFEELGIEATFFRTDPSYIVEIENERFIFWNDFNQTVCDLKVRFPHEVLSLDNFNEFLQTASSVQLVRLKSTPFQNFINENFHDNRLKSVLYSPLFGNTGVNPFKISTFTAVKLYQQYVLDGGYHFHDGMQTLPDILLRRFRYFGGEARMASTVERIIVEDYSAIGVCVNGEEIYSNNVVSNADCRQTFLTMMGQDMLPNDFIDTLKNLRPSSSMFILYISLKKPLESFIKPSVTHWFFNDFEMEKIYKRVDDSKFSYDWIALRLSEDQKKLQVFTIAPYISKDFWDQQGSTWRTDLLKKINRKIPGLLENLDFVLSGSPETIRKWTSNFNGATCGWANSADQFGVSGLSQKTPIKNLYLTGHWTTVTLGIPGVVNVAKKLGESIK